MPILSEDSEAALHIGPHDIAQIEDCKTAEPEELSSRNPSREAFRANLPQIDDESLAMFLYTSGTTGIPKGRHDHPRQHHGNRDGAHHLCSNGLLKMFCCMSCPSFMSMVLWWLSLSLVCRGDKRMDASL